MLTGTSTQYVFLTSRPFTTSYAGACPERSRGNAASFSVFRSPVDSIESPKTGPPHRPDTAHKFSLTYY